MIRLFVGLGLPDDLRQRLAGLNGGVPGARWVAAENLHVTLRFIGEVDRDHAADIDAALRAVVAVRFDLRLQGVGTFGRGRKLHSLWAGVESDPALTALHARVDRALVGAGIAPDNRKFMPHVTLARLKAAKPRRVDEFIAAHGPFAAGPVAVRAFVLYTSLLSKNGALYRPEAEYPLVAG